MFAGVYFLPEYYTSSNVIFRGEPVGFDDDGEPYGYVHSGLEPDFKDRGYDDIYGPSRHLTIVFNAFVCMQVANFFNSRKIFDEFNIFEGISRSRLF